MTFDLLAHPVPAELIASKCTCWPEVHSSSSAAKSVPAFLGSTMRRTTRPQGRLEVWRFPAEPASTLTRWLSNVVLSGAAVCPLQVEYVPESEVRGDMGATPTATFVSQCRHRF